MNQTTNSEEAGVDPYGLRAAGEALADGSEMVRRFGITKKRLRYLRIERKIRYIDQQPDKKPGRGASNRYLYAVSDVEQYVLSHGDEDDAG